MLTVANLLILFLAGAAAWLGTAALVQKRTVRREKDAPPGVGTDA
jgi:hypothetical protein